MARRTSGETALRQESHANCVHGWLTGCYSLALLPSQLGSARARCLCRLLHIQGPPARIPEVVHSLFNLLLAEGAPKNKAFFRCVPLGTLLF